MREPRLFRVYAAAVPAMTAPAGTPQYSSRAASQAAGTFPDTDKDFALRERQCGLNSHHTLPPRAGIRSARDGSCVGGITR